jgi:hypothetical protein
LVVPGLRNAATPYAALPPRKRLAPNTENMLNLLYASAKRKAAGSVPPASTLRTGSCCGQCATPSGRHHTRCFACQGHANANSTATCRSGSAYEMRQDCLSVSFTGEMIPFGAYENTISLLTAVMLGKVLPCTRVAVSLPASLPFFMPESPVKLQFTFGGSSVRLPCSFTSKGKARLLHGHESVESSLEISLVTHIESD